MNPVRLLEVLYTPADFGTLPGRDLYHTTCVVFDVLRATTSMITALGNGPRGIIPVAEISEAMEVRARQPDVLLAGERHGLRIKADQTGGVDFDFGNSPREFTAEKVKGRTIVTTTTNGTRALRACATAQNTLVGCFLNIEAVAQRVMELRPEHLILVCSGTFEQPAYEDVLAAGALLECLGPKVAKAETDMVPITRQVWDYAKGNLQETIKVARNAATLLRNPDLADDVAFSLRRNAVPVVAVMTPSGEVKIG